VSISYSEKRREDPELRGKVERLLDAQNAALLDAAQVLEGLSKTMRNLSIDTNPIYDRCVHAVGLARWNVSGDADFMNRNAHTDTYIGNMAAGEMGFHLQGLDFEARFKGKA
jgi:hypothetical protein